MFGSLFKKSIVSSVVIPTTCTLLLPVESTSNGVLSRSSEFRVVDAAAPENQFKASDFSVGNLEAIGAYNLMKQICMVNTSKLNAADSFDNFNVEQNVSQS